MTLSRWMQYALGVRCAWADLTEGGVTWAVGPPGTPAAGIPRTALWLQGYRALGRLPATRRWEYVDAIIRADSGSGRAPWRTVPPGSA
jgi:hypothetical protein